MTARAPFEAFYQSDLLPDLEQLEAKRKQVVAKLTTAGLIIGALAVAGAITLAAAAPSPMFGLFALVLGVIIYAGVYSYITRDFVAEFKGSIVSRIVKYVDPDLTYHPQQSISQQEYMASRIFQTSPDRFRGEDLVQGTVGKTEIRFSELHSEYKTTSTDSKGRTKTHWHTIFKGLFFIADFNKHFSGQTVVLPDTAESLFGRLGQALQSINISRSGKLVQLEDPEFERLFVVYSDDQVEARYILSTSLMARIVEFRNRTGHDLYISFVNSSIHVAISSSKNLFEPKLFRSLLETGLAQEYLDDLMLAVGIVEELNLNTRIWTKK